MDKVNHPKHYTNGAVECIDAIASAVAGKNPLEAVCVANVVKYLWRYNAKNGLEDVLKAKWYLDRLEKAVRSRTEYRDDAECRPAQVDPAECRPAPHVDPYNLLGIATAPNCVDGHSEWRQSAHCGERCGGKTNTDATDEVLAANLA